jgi:hypothetical protein
MKRTAFAVAAVIGGLAVVTAGTAGVEALITGAQIQDGTIKSRDVGNGAIRRVDIAPATVASLRGRRGPVGARGAQGAPGPVGAQGAQGPAGAQGSAGPAGPAGPPGPTGSTGATGATGEKGDPGAGVHVTGSVATAAGLPATGEEGDAYIALDTGHLHVWDGEAWIDTGPVRGPEGPQGETGPQGAPGPEGPVGPVGPAGADGGLAGYEIVTGSAVVLTGGEVGSATASCPTGKAAVGGGVSVADPSVAGLMVESRPLALGSGWSVSVFNDSAGDTTITPYAVCANLP